tara:strand:- start:71 stop:367 length:297 start_codon:yes stop_codon:yes gene_type:complete
MKRQSRSLNLEAGSVERYQVNGKLPYNFITLLIERYKNRQIEPVHKPLVNKHRHGLKASDEEFLYLKKEALKFDKIQKEGANGLIRALINGDKGNEVI